jgi:release factor glutamine methyltransferase
MNIEQALAFGRRQLAASTDASIDARLLLQHVLKAEHASLIARHADPMSSEQEALYTTLVARAVRREPIPYIIGEAPFFGRMYYVNHSVLIPRPETELLVETALEIVGRGPGTGSPYVIDAGTGSGCVAITLALALPEACIEATDISAAALDVARQNAARHQVADRVQFRIGSLLGSSAGRPDLVVANLPYVADPEWTDLAEGVKWYEPPLALRGGPDGLELIRPLLEQAKTRLAAGGAICLEIGWQQGSAAARLAREHFPRAEVAVRADYSGLDRIVTIQTG